MRNGGLIVLLLLLCNSIYGQTIIEGIVKEKSPLEGCIVSLHEQQKIIGYCITDKKGYFRIAYTSSRPKITLSARLLGYEKKEMEIDNHAQSINIYLPEQAITLKEVNVKGKALWMREDTLVYRVEAFKNTQDRVIGDILKKLPGIEVSPSGSIQYKGEPINKFYIEGMDLLENKYGIATNNLPADAIRNVEILEDHQPVNLLRGMVTSNQAAVNLKLKNNKMSRPSGSVEGGAGYGDDLLWLLNTLAMQFDSKRQTLATYKTNNAGNDITREVKNHSLDANSSSNEFEGGNRITLFNAGNMNQSSGTEKQYLFNKTHVVSINNLWKLSDDNQLRINLNYVADNRNQTIHKTSMYFTDDAPLTIIEMNRLEQESNSVDATFTYTSNSSRSFFKNSFKGKGAWNKTYSGIQITQLIGQCYQMPQFNMTNNLHYAHKKQNRVLNFSSYTNYTSMPQELVLNIDTAACANKQRMHYSGFYTNNSTRFIYANNSSNLDLNIYAKALLENLNTSLEHAIIKDSIRNRLNYDFLELGLNPVYTYKINKFSFALELPVRIRYLKRGDREYRNSKNQSFTDVMPRLSAKYALNTFTNISLVYRKNKELGDITDLTTAYMMTDYRNLRRHSGILDERNTQSGNMHISYRNPILNLFAYTNITYMKSINNILSGWQITEQQSLLENREQNNKIGTWIWNSHIGKYFSSIQSTISLTGNIFRSNSERLRQNSAYKIQSTIYDLSPQIRMKINNSFNFSYEGGLNINKQDVKTSLPAKNQTKRLSNSLYLHFLIRQIELNIQGQHFYNKMATAESNSFFFANLNAKYQYNKKIELSFFWDNILNKKEYIHTICNEFDTYTFTQTLRPAQILLTMKINY